MIKKVSKRLSSTFIRYSRVWRLLKKPTLYEFKTISKVTVIGLLIIGAIGFLISLVMKIFSV
ncbi:protein translocase SEC61 complex subunit gamma [Candidatus Pacearchaeota archaeon]|nr:MAG: protein translocase SEC61 complex subunit gamma [Candidatus Pacearchaeota archaeon]